MKYRIHDLYIIITYKAIFKVRQYIMNVCGEYQKLHCSCGVNVKFIAGGHATAGMGRRSIILGNNVLIKGELQTLGHGGQITIGKDSYVGTNTFIWSGKRISIGDRVLISNNCNIFDNDTHPLNAEERSAQYQEITKRGQPKNINLNDKEIVIEDDVLICTNVTIMKGVTIGKGAVIGCNSVVTKDVPAGVVAYGNPARVVKRIGKEGKNEGN